MISASEWHDKFIIGFIEDSSIEEAFKFYSKPSGNGSRKWSNSMFKFLRCLGEANGFTVIQERRLVDMEWLDDKKNVIVAIEHENDGHKIDNIMETEVNKLLLTNSALKVLIVYFKGEYFDKLVKELNSRIMEKLKSHNRFDFEFLLLASTVRVASSPEDQYWFSYQYKPCFRNDIILLP
jgi:hypothetical protein